jgi:hypothetical protein
MSGTENFILFSKYKGHDSAKNHRTMTKIELDLYFLKLISLEPGGTCKFVREIGSYRAKFTSANMIKVSILLFKSTQAHSVRRVTSQVFNDPGSYGQIKIIKKHAL